VQEIRLAAKKANEEARQGLRMPILPGQRPCLAGKEMRRPEKVKARDAPSDLPDKKKRASRPEQ